MNALVGLNLGVRFLVELAALAAFVAWGAAAVGGAPGWLLGVGAAAAFAAVWGLLVSPKARVRLGNGARLSVEFALLAAAALALVGAGETALALVFAIIALVSGAINAITR